MCLCLSRSHAGALFARLPAFGTSPLSGRLLPSVPFGLHGGRGVIPPSAKPLFRLAGTRKNPFSERRSFPRDDVHYIVNGVSRSTPSARRRAWQDGRRETRP